MSRRRVDPRQHEFDRALRSALHMAVDSVEPGAGGLDQIRTKIAAQRSARRELTWQAATRAGGSRSWWRTLLPPRDWLPAVAGAVVERFKPDPNRAGWFGWLRPAAAVTTGLFVVTAASWAVAALPSAINPPTSSRTISSSRSTPAHHGRAPTSGFPYSTGNSGGSTGPQTGRSGGTGNPHSTPSCTTPASGPSGSPTGTPTGSASPTVSGSTSTSPSTSPSTSVSSSSTSQTSSPTVGGPSSTGSTSNPTPATALARPTSPEATVKALLTPDGLGAGLLAGPVVPTQTPPPTASPTVSGPASSSQTGSPPPSTPCAGA